MSVYRTILAQHLGFGWGPFQRRRGNLGVEVKRGGFQRLGEAGQAFLRLIREHRFPSVAYGPSFLTAEDKSPRGSRGNDKGDRRSWGDLAFSDFGLKSCILKEV